MLINGCAKQGYLIGPKRKVAKLVRIQHKEIRNVLFLEIKSGFIGFQLTAVEEHIGEQLGSMFFAAFFLAVPVAAALTPVNIGTKYTFTS